MLNFKHMIFHVFTCKMLLCKTGIITLFSYKLINRNMELFFVGQSSRDWINLHKKYFPFCQPNGFNALHPIVTDIVSWTDWLIYFVSICDIAFFKVIRKKIMTVTALALGYIILTYPRLLRFRLRLYIQQSKQCLNTFPPQNSLKIPDVRSVLNSPTGNVKSTY